MTSEAITRNYFNVLTNNEPVFRHLDMDNFVEVLGYLFTRGDINFGKFSLPVSEISGKVHEFVEKSVSNIKDHEMIGGNDDYYLFKEHHGLYFHITWNIDNDMIEFVILHGANYASDVNGVYVFNDDDASTVVSDDYYTTDFSDDSDDSDFDVNDMSDL